MKRALLIAYTLLPLLASARDTCIVKGKVMAGGKVMPGVVVAALYQHSLLCYSVTDSAGDYTLSINLQQQRTLSEKEQVCIQYIKDGYETRTIRQQVQKLSNKKEANLTLYEERQAPSPKVSIIQLGGQVIHSKMRTPVAGAVVFMWQGEHLLHAAVTNPEGRYSIVMGEGHYTIAASAHGFYDKMEEVTIKAGTSTIDLAMNERPKTIRLVDPHEK
jgi:hypothetical protein